MLFLVFVTHALQFVILGTLALITLTMPLIVSPLSPHAGGYYGISGLPDKRLDSSYRKRRSNLSNKSKFCFPQIQISTAPKMSGLLRLTGSEPLYLYKLLLDHPLGFILLLHLSARVAPYEVIQLLSVLYL